MFLFTHAAGLSGSLFPRKVAVLDALIAEHQVSHRLFCSTIGMETLYFFASALAAFAE